MSLISVTEVANFLGVKNQRVERLERESLLTSKAKDSQGKPLFDRNEVEKYKEFAERVGGI
ncbi:MULTISPECIES: helix-turn-helix domain-containing protein [Aliiglaciecola]|uniref:helix-turn-helix domain-containing protein n=1 Tax=Aliiglaciecola TaxID=1406885 RepID=UPI001C092988|nr:MULTISPECIES: helix-turn-helix domain-containing protein [Aliiglaciecola]MBU2878887.1 helix-turn-helix domain-containing protein [Aliiglaciecola lipolytica]MDO6712966.1 helix-turn-helix domain-containing protein [Aliiglaciecola sp. 2_MG-2023]MDO6754005.1 helix-turn-helix domain-containing protein [Aliiglaciecola sp. 1_MG-2023]